MNLEGVQALNKNEQKSINGGKVPTCKHVYCIWRCVKGKCVGPNLS